MEVKTESEMADDHAAVTEKIRDVQWNPSLGWGLGAGAVVGVIVFAVTIAVLPFFYESIDIIK
jgi:AAT family amino acid transporter